jgi:hypothetical protein
MMPSERFSGMGWAPETWTDRDLLFVVKTLLPERSDPEAVVDLVRQDPSLLESMLEDDRLFQRLVADDEILLRVSPRFFFQVLLLRARRDLAREAYTLERRDLQSVALFDANEVVELLAQPAVCHYLATLLASFSRIHSATIPIRVAAGIWRRYRVNDLDVESLVRYAQVLDEQERFGTYQRIADACLFLSGIYPEFIQARQRYPYSGQPRARFRSSLLHSLEDYEAYGRAFYRLAAGHKQARIRGLDRILGTLSDRFILAEKPLALLAERYLVWRKHHVFGL